MDNVKNDNYYLDKIRTDIEFIIAHMKDVDLQDLNDNEVLLDRKTELNCFTNPELKEYIAKSGERTLVIIGLMTNYCVDASVKAAAKLGYEVIVPVGANSTSDRFKIGGLTTCRHYNEVEWPVKYARCISIDEALAMMEYGASFK